MLKKLEGYKTYIAVILGAVFNVGVVAGWWEPENSVIAAVDGLLGFFGLGFLRAGVNKAASGGGMKSFLAPILIGCALGAAGYSSPASAQTRQTVFDFPEVNLAFSRLVDAPDGNGSTVEFFSGGGFAGSYSLVEWSPSDSLWKTVVGIGAVVFCRKIAGELWQFNPGLKLKGLEYLLWPLEPSIAATYHASISARRSVLNQNVHRLMLSGTGPTC